MSDKHEWTPEGLRMTAAKLVYSSNHYLYHEMPDTEAAVMGDALFLAADQMEALSAATQALTDMGCELRDGVWMKSNQCECCACCCDQNHADMPIEWLPITPIQETQP